MQGTTPHFTWLVTKSTVQISKSIMCQPAMRRAHIICFSTHCHASKLIMWTQWLQSNVLNSMQQSPFWKVKSWSASQKILHLFENLQLHFLVLTTVGARWFHSTLSNPIHLRPILILTSIILVCLRVCVVPSTQDYIFSWVFSMNLIYTFLPFQHPCPSSQSHIKYCNTQYFYDEELLAMHTIHPGGLPIIGCPWLFIKYHTHPHTNF
jgi:hypothetical protein